MATTAYIALRRNGIGAQAGGIPPATGFYLKKRSDVLADQAALSNRPIPSALSAAEKNYAPVAFIFDIDLPGIGRFSSARETGYRRERESINAKAAVF